MTVKLGITLADETHRAAVAAGVSLLGSVFTIANRFGRDVEIVGG